MKLILQVFYSVFSGVLLSLAIPNEIYLLGCPIFAFFAIIPYYLAIKTCTNYKNAFWVGFIQTLTTHLISSFWLSFFKDFAIFTLGASALATAFFGAIFAMFLYMPFSFSTLRRQEKTNPIIEFISTKKFYELKSFRIFYFASIYTLFEYFKSNGFLGYPWGTVSSSMYKFPILTQIADIFGTYGITFIVVVFNIVFYESIKTIRIYYSFKNEFKKTNLHSDIKYSAIVFSLLFSLSMIYGTVQYYKTRTPVKQITTITVQQNTDPWEIYDDNKNVLIAENLSQNKINELKEKGIQPQLIVWSEGTLSKTFPNAIYHYERYPSQLPLKQFIKNNQIPLIAGAPYSKFLLNKNGDFLDRKLFNATVIFDKDANLRGYYGKLHLVPFAELIPGMHNPIIKKLVTKLVKISSGWDKGETYTYYDVECTNLNYFYTTSVNIIDISKPYVNEPQEKTTVRICTPVCFDDSFTDVMRPLFLNGAELFINLSDDSWSLKKSSELQHFVISSFRAIEYRTTLVRSSNAGYSVVLDPAGKIICDQPLFTECACAFDVPIYKRQMTIYARYGDVLPLACLLLLIISSFYAYKISIYVKSKKIIKISRTQNKK